MKGAAGFPCSRGQDAVQPWEIAKYWGRKLFSIWAVYQKCRNMVGLASLPDGYPLLWGELIAIPEVEDLKKLAWKIWAFFSIPTIRCETFPDQGYTVPPGPKCLTRSRFIPDNPAYQDVQLQPLLKTMAYAQAWQFWAEWAILPDHPDPCHLAMSIVELMWQLRGHLTFYKWDILKNLEGVVPETVGRDLATPQGCPVTQPSPINQFLCPPQLVLTMHHLVPWALLSPSEQ